MHQWRRKLGAAFDGEILGALVGACVILIQRLLRT